MLGMKNHFDISNSIEIREADIAGVACSEQAYLHLPGYIKHLFLKLSLYKSVCFVVTSQKTEDKRLNATLTPSPS